MNLIVNGNTYVLDVEPDMPLLWALRDELGIKGPKFGCGKGLCGACTVLIDGLPMRSCSLPLSAVSGEITTVEGLGTADNLSVLQQVWVERQVAQCGYCQSGQLMSATALLEANPNPDDEEIKRYMSGNLCRCATYPRIKSAIKEAASKLSEASFYDAASQPSVEGV